MKRFIASLASAVMLFGIATPAFASPSYGTKNKQTRVSIRQNRERARVAYRKRARAYLALRREHYNAVIRPAISRPHYLTVTGVGAKSSEARAVARPGKRIIQGWVLSDHCTLSSRQCND